MHTWLPHLAAAPLVWTDSRHAVQNTKLDFEFAAYLAKAVPGETWLERKVSIVNGKTVFPETLRWRCAQDLILTLAVLERANLVHGDLSRTTSSSIFTIRPTIRRFTSSISMPSPRWRPAKASRSP